MPPPAAFSRPGPRRLIIGIYDLRLALDLERLGRKARSLAAEAGENALRLLRRARSLARPGPAGEGSVQEIPRGR